MKVRTFWFALYPRFASVVRTISSHITSSPVRSSQITQPRHDLEIGVRGHSMSLKLVPFESLDAVSYSSTIVTVAVSVIVCKIFNVKECRDLKN